MIGSASERGLRSSPGTLIDSEQQIYVTKQQQQQQCSFYSQMQRQ